MVLAAKFEGQTEFKRRGVCTKVVYNPAEKRPLELSKEDKCIYIGSDSKTLALTDEVGLKGKAVCMLIFVQGGVLLEILSGSVYIKSVDGAVVRFKAGGAKSKVVDEGLVWKSSNELLEHIRALVCGKYYLNRLTPRELSRYVDNLAYEVRLESGGVLSDGAKMTYSLGLNECVQALGLGEIEFEDYSAERPKVKPKSQGFRR